MQERALLRCQIDNVAWSCTQRTCAPWAAVQQVILPVHLPCPRWVASSLQLASWLCQNWHLIPGFVIIAFFFFSTMDGCLLWTGWRLSSSPFRFSFCASEGRGVKWFIQHNNNFYIKEREFTKQGDEMWISWSLSLILSPFHVGIENCVLLNVNGC